jgi:hypothetical protein
MAAWQVDFYMIPRAALQKATRRFSDDWWTEASLPPNYRERLDAFVARASTTLPDAEVWGTLDGDRVDVWSVDGRPVRVHVHVDVRRADSKFAAGLITFARAAGAVLVRTDGALIVEPTVTAFSRALRTSTAWELSSQL